MAEEEKERKGKREPDVPGGPVVKNPTANTEDMGSNPGQGRFQVLRATKPVCHSY